MLHTLIFHLFSFGKLRFIHLCENLNAYVKILLEMTLFGPLTAADGMGCSKGPFGAAGCQGATTFAAWADLEVGVLRWLHHAESRVSHQSLVMEHLVLLVG